MKRSKLEEMRIENKFLVYLTFFGAVTVYMCTVSSIVLVFTVEMLCEHNSDVYFADDLECGSKRGKINAIELISIFSA